MQGLACSRGSCSTARPVPGMNTGLYLSRSHRICVVDIEGTLEVLRANPLLQQGYLATQDSRKKNTPALTSRCCHSRWITPLNTMKLCSHSHPSLSIPGDAAPLQDTYRETSSSFPREMHGRSPRTFSQLGVWQCSLPYRQRSIKNQNTTFSVGTRKQRLSRTQT